MDTNQYISDVHEINLSKRSWLASDKCVSSIQQKTAWEADQTVQWRGCYFIQNASCGLFYFHSIAFLHFSSYHHIMSFHVVSFHVASFMRSLFHLIEFHSKSIQFILCHLISFHFNSIHISSLSTHSMPYIHSLICAIWTSIGPGDTTKSSGINVWTWKNKNISPRIKDIYNLQQWELDNAAADLARDQALFVGSKYHHHPTGHNFHSTAQLRQDAAVASTSRIGLCNGFWALCGVISHPKKKKKLQVLYWGVQGDKKKIGSELPGPNRMCSQQLATKWNKTSWYVLETTLPPIIMVFCGKNGCVSSIISFLEKLVGNLHWTIIMGERVSLLGGSSHLQAIKRSWMQREQGPTTPVLGDNNDRHGS